MNGLPRMTVAAAIAVLLTALSLKPTMVDLTWLRATILCVAVVAATGYLARRARLPALLIPLVELAVLALVLTLRFAQTLAVWEFLPGSDVVAEARRLITEATDTISAYAPPSAVTPGLVFLIAMSVGIVAVVVDTAGVTFRSPALAGIPLLVLYAVPVAVMNNVSWIYFLLGAVGWLGLLLADGRERLGGWGRRLGTRSFAGDPTTDARSAPEPLGAVGRRIGALSLAFAILLPAVLPGLSDTLFGGGNGIGSGGKNTVKTVNPYVSLASELNRPNDTEVFTYSTDAKTPDYLSLVPLDSFDGTNWVPVNLESSGRISDALPAVSGLGATTARIPVSTTVTLTGLPASTWLPVPYPPTAVAMDVGRTKDWVWDISNRVAWSPKSSSDQLQYTVSSLEVRPTRTQLVNPELVDNRQLQRYLDLPDDIPEDVRRQAEEVTAGASTEFARALALQDWFREPGLFRYSAQAKYTGKNALSDFLRDKNGFCQQFAGAFAVMGRLVQLPTRVVVGFVPGEKVDDTTWQVTWHDVHAWPEVYFQGTGWVRFEPTPRTDNAGVAVPEWTLDVANPGVEERPDRQGGTPDDSSPSASASGDLPLGAQGAERDRDASALADAEQGIPWVWVLVPLGVVLLLLSPWALRLDQRRRRLNRTKGPDPRPAAAAAWTELAATCTDLGRTWPGSRTPRQVARDLIAAASLEAHAPSAADALRRLALATERGRYARSPELVAGLASDVTTARQGLFEAATRRQRLQAKFLPRSLMSRAAAHTADALDWVDTAPRRARRLVSRPSRRTRSRTP